MTSGGDVYAADYVVVTVPLGILKSSQIQFSPPLPDVKQTSIERLGTKLVTIFYYIS